MAVGIAVSKYPTEKATPALTGYNVRRTRHGGNVVAFDGTLEQQCEPPIASLRLNEYPEFPHLNTNTALGSQEWLISAAYGYTAEPIVSKSSFNTVTALLWSFAKES